jgi:hypothetical protein
LDSFVNLFRFEEVLCDRASAQQIAYKAEEEAARPSFSREAGSAAIHQTRQKNRKRRITT